MFKSKKIDIGASIRKRVEEYPAFSRAPKKKPDCWVECPDFDIKKMKRITKEDEEKNRPYTVTIFASDYETMRKMLNRMIAVGKKEIVADNMMVWLHATKFLMGRAKGQALHTCVLTYIFRIEAMPEEKNLSRR